MDPTFKALKKNIPKKLAALNIWHLSLFRSSTSAVQALLKKIL